MKGGNLPELLANSLNPSLTNASYHALSQLKHQQGFAIQLLLISDDHDCHISIRQSALIHLKNLLQDHSTAHFLPQTDLDTLKASLLEALIRNVANPKLTPTYREIIFQMAQQYYPREWPSIVEDAVARVEKGTDLGGLFGAVEALKAVFSVFGGSVSKEIELNNLSNKSLLPLLSLASRLFQNFNAETSHVLVSLFKLLNTAIMFYLPHMLKLNIHSLLIFLKKILDLQADLSSPDNASLYLLKRLSLRILFRLYQKYANFRMTEDREFAQHFHAKYTKSFMETLFLQVMLPVEGDRIGRRRGLELIKLSLSCLAYINRQNPEAAALLVQNRGQLLNICLEKFRIPLGRNYQSFSEFKVYTEETRVHVKEFLFSLLTCEAVPEQQGEAVQAILGLLLSCLERGDGEQKELALYLFTEMSTELKYLSNKLDEKMSTLILEYVRPLLKEDCHLLVRARACELIASYSYLQLPEEQTKELATLIYNCLLVGSSENEVFLKIQACHAFNSIMKYNSIADFIQPFIPDILKIYTELLQADASIIKNFQDLINLLDHHIAPYANDLVKLLAGMFTGYTRPGHQGSQPYSQAEGRGDQEEDGEDKEEEGEDKDKEEDCNEEEEEDSNHEMNARACISSIREILQSGSASLDEGVRQQLLDLVVWVFSDSQQNFIEEGYNVLNLLLYKSEGIDDSQYYLFFRVIAYAILGLPQEHVEDLRKKGDHFSLKYADLLQNICVDPDTDIIENSIGCLRNFVAKSSREALCGERDEFGFSYMDYILKIVKFVHENQSGRASQTDRLIILTLYITLIEHQRVDEQQLSEITTAVTQWMAMEQEVVEQQVTHQPHAQLKVFGQNAPKYTYSSVYLQILLLAVNFYDQKALRQFNVHPVVEKTVALADHFKCDYELSRVIVGFSHLLDNQVIGEEGLVRSMLGALPELVRRLCKIRQEGDDAQNDLDMDDEAEEERVFGDDENTHVMGLNQGGAPSDKDLMLRGEDEDDDSDWEEEFNKFYVSPLDQTEELQYLGEVMKRQGHIYGAFMSQEKQEELSLYLANAPLKANAN